MGNQKQVESTQDKLDDKIDPLKDFTGYIESNKDIKKFYSMSLLSGDITDTPTEMDKRQFTTDYQIWLKAGKPKPVMPTIQKGVVKIPTAAYRIRDRGNDKMYICYNDGTINGKKITSFKKKIKDPITGELKETNEIDHTKPSTISYDLDFTKNTAQAVIDDAAKLVSPGSKFNMYFFYKGVKKQVSEKVFILPYDEIAEFIERKQTIN